MSAGTDRPAGGVAGSISVGTYLLLAGIGVVLVAGYVVLAALGRDTTGYVLFLGGPAVTGVMGAILSHRVGNVGAAVEATKVETKAFVADTVSVVDDHLTEQDKTLTDIAGAIPTEPAPAAPAAGGKLPAARSAGESVFGPISSGLISHRRPND